MDKAQFEKDKLNEIQSGKRHYVSPKLEDFGTIRTVTLGSPTPDGDSSGDPFNERAPGGGG